jgi:hypothetical protein
VAWSELQCNLTASTVVTLQSTAVCPDHCGGRRDVWPRRKSFGINAFRHRRDLQWDLPPNTRDSNARYVGTQAGTPLTRAGRSFVRVALLRVDGQYILFSVCCLTRDIHAARRCCAASRSGCDSSGRTEAIRAACLTRGSCADSKCVVQYAAMRRRTSDKSNCRNEVYRATS